ncbi:TPA: hypothetical protein O5S09_001708 [Staphylococcus aureus]|uniref:hypothetical protein n=1 Tax=Staphylococcus aureus TaxID=1280 RepID=UPI0009224734|nr:hypothetical protein [Staphylococcus aureus]UVJ09193.1 hypothetical protein NW971_06320 [Staphylococcus aureus]SGU89985.1 Uncharacterised protein [Staphylococcus aureus]HAR6696908.1 hypothetical protein [Staphylococcus aureus]HBE8007371.1 hypothetical protein [Staphylococcus aureus]HCY8224305.1 hypothetical protein [Staphylococcus aureus]
MEFKLLDVEGKSIVNVKRINVHAYYLKGIEDTHLDHLKIRINPSELNSFKSKYKLLTEEEYEKKLVKTNELEYTVLDLLISANFNLNKFNTGNLDEDNKSDSIGKHQLSMAVEFISKGLDLSSPIEFYK